jgi:hypothetical protein
MILFVLIPWKLKIAVLNKRIVTQDVMREVVPEFQPCQLCLSIETPAKARPQSK